MPEMIRWTPTLFEAQAGAFSSTKRYVRKAATGSAALAAGVTMSGRYVFHPSTNVGFGASFHFKLGGIEYVFTNDAGTIFNPNPQPAGAPSPAATLQPIAV